MNELKERLLKRIEIDKESGCWMWQGAPRNGYGQIKHGGKTRYTHRMAYALFVGDIPESLHLDHLCRVKLCCNPDHLQPVTNAENIRRGMSTKLTWDEAREIRRLCADGLSQRKIATKFGVSRRLIRLIAQNERWAEETA